MTDLEKHLKETLARREPPPGFAGRVLERIEPVTEPAPWWRTGWLRWSSALATVAMLTVGGWRYQQYRQAEFAKEQLMLALEITAEKFALVEQKLGR